jgi:DNA-binding XRE family transcriptional regulator/DNA-directed RNA polymerase subunit RPC12/RpoP
MIKTKDQHHYTHFKCLICRRLSRRSKEYLGTAECHACGGILAIAEFKDKPYHYACTNCKNIWDEPFDRIKACPLCNSTNIIIQYDDINVKAFETVLQNIESKTKYIWRCSCGATVELYGADNSIGNVPCPNGCAELMRLEFNTAELLEKLKKHRRLHRMSQADLAKKFGISQQSYSNIERGIDKIPTPIMNKIEAFLLLN